MAPALLHTMMMMNKKKTVILQEHVVYTAPSTLAVEESEFPSWWAANIEALPVLPPLPPPIPPPSCVVPETSSSAPVPTNDSSSSQTTNHSSQQQQQLPPTGECSVCLDSLSKHGPIVELRACQHRFHRHCLEDSLRHSSKCPLCRTPVGGAETRGKCPSGTLRIRVIHVPCPGFSNADKNSNTTIQLTYHIPNGIQAPHHDHPGRRYSGTTRDAYLPNTREGQELCCRLKYAWQHGLIFGVGTSLTTGQADTVVWMSLPHKTSLHGGTHGFPDDDYCRRCSAALDAAHVPPAADLIIAQHNNNNTNSNNNNSNVSVTVRDELVPYTAPSSLATSQNREQIYKFLGGPGQPDDETSCNICWKSVLSSDQGAVVRIRSCRHTFHHQCLDTALRADPNCPACHTLLVGGTPPRGTCPSGTLDIVTTDQTCPGFFDDGNNATTQTTIELRYAIPSGIQQSYHPQPGAGYEGAINRVAYLPNNDDGRLLLRRIKYAWLRGLCFSVGTSLTSGRANVVTWSAALPHKTSLRGGGPYGFPDAQYLAHCHAALDRLQVPKSEDCPEIESVARKQRRRRKSKGK